MIPSLEAMAKYWGLTMFQLKAVTLRLRFCLMADFLGQQHEETDRPSQVTQNVDGLVHCHGQYVSHTPREQIEITVVA
jgi:hypothetical protein